MMDLIGAWITKVELRPEDEQLVQKRLRSGGFEDVQQVIHRALQAQDAEEAWLELEVREKIERAIAEFEQGGGIPASEVRQRTVRGKLVNPNLDLDRTSQRGRSTSG